MEYSKPIKFSRITPGQYRATTNEYSLVLNKDEVSGWKLEINDPLTGDTLSSAWGSKKSHLLLRVDALIGLLTDTPKETTTAYPKEPCVTLEDWREHMSSHTEKSPEDLAEEKFEQDFARIWADFKCSIIRARTL